MLTEYLKENCYRVAQSWVNAIVESYPSDTAGFLLKQKDRFANPVGSALRESTVVLMEELTGGMDSERIKHAVDDLMRIRAIQDFSPAQAVGVIFDLKRIIRRETRSLLTNADAISELLEFETRIDIVALHAFDKYAENRERLHIIRADEARRSVAKLKERVTKAGLLEADSSDK